MHINETDPVADPEYPRIRSYNPGWDDPSWPEDWSKEPTERDLEMIVENAD